VGMVAGVALVLIIISGIAILNWKRRPYLPVGWFWFLGVLVPMTGIVFVGIQAMADRFMYVPIIGLILIVCFSAREFFTKRKGGVRTGLITALAGLVIFAA